MNNLNGGILIVFYLNAVCLGRMQVGDISEITSRYFGFSDASRCRQSQFCGVSMEWDLKFGRLIDTTIYYPANSTQSTVNNPGWKMNTIIVAMPSSKDSYDELCKQLASGGNVVLWVKLKNKYIDYDWMCDVLRITFDMYYSNFQFGSKFYQLLNNQTFIITFNKFSDEIFYLNDQTASTNNKCFVHSSIKSIITISPSLLRDPSLSISTNQHIGKFNIPILFVTATNDAHDPIFHSKYLYNRLPTGNPLTKHFKNSVGCKVYIEIQGGNHCYFSDYNISRYPNECLKKEYESRMFKGTPLMSHEYQFDNYGASLILKYINFTNYNVISSYTNEQNIAHFLAYLDNIRDNTANNDIDYLASCFVNHKLFVHTQYFKPDTTQELYRTFSWN